MAVRERRLDRIAQPQEAVRVDQRLWPGASQVILPSSGQLCVITNGEIGALTLSNANNPLSQVTSAGRVHAYRPNPATDVGESFNWSAPEFNVGPDASMLFYGCALSSINYKKLIAYGGASWGLNLRRNSTTEVEAKYVDDPTTAAYTATLSGLPAVEDGQFFAVGLVKRGNAIRVFCQGQSAASSGGNGGIRRSAGSGLDYANEFDEEAYARMALGAICSVPLADDHMHELLRNPWQLFEPERIWVPVSAGGGAAALEGAATVSASAAGALTTHIPLAGAAVLSASAAGSLTTAVQLAGAALAAGQAVGDLSSAIRLTGAAATLTTAAGTLTTQIRLEGAGLAAALAAGTLAGGAAQLAGDATAGAQAAGGLTTLIVLQGAAVGAALAAADLTAPGSGLAGAATAGAQAAASLTTGIPLAGGATVSVIAAGDATTSVSLAGAAVGVVSATGDLVVALALDGAAVAAALAGATLTTAIVMEGAAVVGAQASGTLDGTEVIPIAAGCPPSAPKPTRRRIILEGKVYEVAPRDVPALLKAHLLKRRPPRSVVQVESPVPAPEPAQDAPEEAVEAQSAEPALDAVALLQARADAMLAELRRQAAADVERALLRVLQRQIEQLIDEEEAATLLLMH